MGETGHPMDEWFVLSSIQPGFHSKLPVDADLAVAVFLIITGMMSLLGNGTVLLVYFRKRKKLRHQELMTINLAVCDFGFSLLGAPFTIISRWRMRSCLSDRIYILLILMLCFGFPTIIIVTSYTAILLTVYRSNRTLATIPFSSVSHISSKDLRITKIAAVVCASFLVAWTPYATGSLYSALVLGDHDEPGSWGHLQAEPPGVACGAGASVVPELRGIPSLLNWTWAWPGGDVPYNSPGEDWSNVSNLVAPSTPDPSPPAAAASALSSALSQRGGPETEDPQWPSILPMVSLIPVMLAKSHCMFNPFIYQIMNPEFRKDARDVLFC